MAMNTFSLLGAPAPIHFSRRKVAAKLLAFSPEKDIAVLDLLREVRPPFTPSSVVAEFCATLRSYRVSTVVGDYYGAEWVREQFEKLGVRYVRSEKPKSDIYLSFLPAVNSRQVRLLDNPRLRAQLSSLVRRTRSGGKDSVDHRPGAHDDLANVCAGAVLEALRTAGGALRFLEYLKRGGAASATSLDVPGGQRHSSRYWNPLVRLAR